MGATPAGVVCEGIALEIGRGGTRGLSLAEAAAKRSLGPGWKVEPLGTAGDFLATPPRKLRLTPALAWDLARRLAEEREVASSEPLFAGPGLEPDPKKRSTILAPHERRKGMTSKKDLPCSAPPEWAVHDVGLPAAWDLALPDGGRRYGEGIRIGHPDTGFRLHPELVGVSLLPDLGFDFEDGDADPTDPLRGSAPGHGTATASVLASPRGGPKNPFVSGVAPRAEVVPMRVADGVVHFSFKNLVRALHHAVDSGCHVVSMSLGGPFRSDALERAVDRADAEGTILVAAAGNVWPWVVYPARLPAVVAVAASNCRRAPWSGSAHGPTVDLAAPGESVWRAKVDASGTFDVERSSGTSYATAFVAGAAALWLAFWGRARLVKDYGKAGIPKAFQRVLDEAVDVPTGWDAKRYGEGILNVHKLLRSERPEAVAAKGGRKAGTRPTPRRPGDLDAVLAYFPDVDPDRVLAGLRDVLGAKPGALRRAMREAVDEIAFWLAADAAVRSAVFQGTIPRRKASKAAVARGAKRLRAGASTGLLRLLEG